MKKGVLHLFLLVAASLSLQADVQAQAQTQDTKANSKYSALGSWGTQLELPDLFTEEPSDKKVSYDIKLKIDRDTLTYTKTCIPPWEAPTVVSAEMISTMTENKITVLGVKRIINEPTEKCSLYPLDQDGKVYPMRLGYQVKNSVLYLHGADQAKEGLQENFISLQKKNN